MSNSTEVWNNGVPLNAIELIRSESDLDQKFQQLCHSELALMKTNSPFNTDLWSFLKTEAVNMLPDMDIIHAVNSRKFQRHPTIGIFVELIELLSLGRMRAFGFVTPRQVSSPVEQVPVDIWKNALNEHFYIKWSQNEVRGNGLGFTAVRIVPPLVVVETSDEKNVGLATGGTKRMLGRPSVQGKIFEAYDDLREAGQINFDHPMTESYPVIRKLLAAKYPNDSERLGNLADETIRKTISDLFKKDQKTNKQ